MVRGRSLAAPHRGPAMGKDERPPVFEADPAVVKSTW